MFGHSNKLNTQSGLTVNNHKGVTFYFDGSAKSSTSPRLTLAPPFTNSRTPTTNVLSLETHLLCTIKGNTCSVGILGFSDVKNKTHDRSAESNVSNDARKKWYINLHMICVRAGKTLARQCGYTSSPEPSLDANSINTKSRAVQNIIKRECPTL